MAGTIHIESEYFSADPKTDKDEEVKTEDKEIKS